MKIVLKDRNDDLQLQRDNETINVFDGIKNASGGGGGGGGGVSSIDYDTINKKLTKTVDSITSDVVTASFIVTDGGGLKTHQTIKQDGITGATANRYATCSIAAGTAAKTASIISGTPSLEAGLHVFVKFTNANTAASPTLNINSTGAKSIAYNGTVITTDSNLYGLLKDVCEFVYDGTNWNLVNKATASGGDISTYQSYTNPTSVTLKASEHSYLKFTSAVSCSISLNTINAGIDEIALEIDCVGVAPTITFPNTIKWVEAPTFSAGKHFEISIKYCDSKYYAVWNSWSIS